MASRPPKRPTLTLDANLVQILNASRLPVTFPKQFTYLSVEIRDKGESNILSCIPTTNIFIEAAIDSSNGGGGVLVHCFGGKSRSPAFVAAYLMSSRGWSFDAAYALVKAARPTVDINAGFECQLRAYGAANYDVYIAQQLLLRTRIRALYPLKGNEAFLSSVDVKASDRIASTHSQLNTRPSNANNPAFSGGGYTKHDNDPDKATGPEESTLHFSLSSAGQKRSWHEDKTSCSGGGGGDLMDVAPIGGQQQQQQRPSSSSSSSTPLRSMSNDMEESAAMQKLQLEQLHTVAAATATTDSGTGGAGGDSADSSIAFRSGGSPSNAYPATSTGSSGSSLPCKTPRAKGRVNRGGRSLRSDADVEAKTPSCRLSRPGSSWVRVIPPLRGLEREFKCSWCNVALFSLANVIRTDLDVVSLLDSAVRAEEKEGSAHSHSRANTPRLDAIEGLPLSPTAGARTLSEASGLTATGAHARSFSYSGGGGGGKVTFGMLPPTPRTTAAMLASANAAHSAAVGAQNGGAPGDEGVAMTVQTPRQTPRGGGSDGCMFPALNAATPRSAAQLAAQQPKPLSSSFSFQQPIAPVVCNPMEADSGAAEMEVDGDSDEGFGSYDRTLSDSASPKNYYPAVCPAPLKSSRAGGGSSSSGGAKGFSFDIPMINLGDNGPAPSVVGGGGFKASPESKASLGLGSARSGGSLTARSGGILINSPTSARSPKASARDGPVNVSFASDSKFSGGCGGGSSAKSLHPVARNLLTSNSYSGSSGSLPLIHPNSGSSSSRPSSANTATFSYNQHLCGGGGGALYDDSPRIQIPAHRANESWSPQDMRPQSAEKRRWLARVNLLREVPDSKASKLADDDDTASYLGSFGGNGADKYFYVEYLDWMGKELFAAGNDIGDIHCRNCRKVVGSFVWKPSVRLTLNSRLEAPLFRIHKHVVHQTEWVFDATPKSTPRPSFDGDLGHGTPTHSGGGGSHQGSPEHGQQQGTSPL